MSEKSNKSLTINITNVEIGGASLHVTYSDGSQILLREGDRGYDKIIRFLNKHPTIKRDPRSKTRKAIDDYCEDHSCRQKSGNACGLRGYGICDGSKPLSLTLNNDELRERMDVRRFLEFNGYL